MGWQVVFGHEYLLRVRRRGFWLVTFLLLLFVVLMGVWPSLLVGREFKQITVYMDGGIGLACSC